MTEELIRTSYSSLNQHRNCPQAWNYAKLQRLGRDEGTAARDAGSWWQALRIAEAMERGRRHDSLHFVPRKVQTADHGPVFQGESITLKEVFEKLADWWEASPWEYREDVEKLLGYTMPVRLEMALDAWMDHYAEDLPYEQPLGMEIWWQKKLVKDGKALATLGGFVDEAYFDTRRGMIVIRDNKFVKNIDKSTLSDMMDSQLHLYAWGASSILKQWGVGRLGAVSFDRVRSAMQTPQLTRSGSLSKQVTAFDRRAYERWVSNGISYPGLRKDGSGAGIYTAEQSVLEKLDSQEERERWFQRTLVPINTRIVQSHVRAAIDSAEDIHRTLERVKLHGEAQRNATSSCNWCEFSKLCLAQMIGGPDGSYDPADYGLVQRPGRKQKG